MWLFRTLNNISLKMSYSTSLFLPKPYKLHISQFCPISLKTYCIWVVEKHKISFGAIGLNIDI
jgi:hypothetical protein